MTQPHHMYRTYGKAAIDRTAAAALLLAAAPVMAVVATAVRWRLGGPVIFSQVRPGRHGRPFRMFKFRTMSDARDASGRLLPDSVRLTRFGRWLRSTSLDELPELWNVLRGEMSLVGPRPLLTEYLPHYTAEQAKRHDVKPGITGWAQVQGRNSVTWDERFELDRWYVRHVSLAVDLHTILLTISTVVARRGVSAEGHATMPPFADLDVPSREPRRRAA